MENGLTRRRFLGSAAAAGAATLLTSATAAAAAGARDGIQKNATEDTANQHLTESSVAKVQWKARPFPMPDVRLLPSFWKNMMELDRSYLYSLPNERLAHNFRVT